MAASFRSRNSVTVVATMSPKLAESWVDSHQCSSMFSCFEACVAHVGLVFGDHMFSTAKSSGKSMQRLERSFTKLRRGCIRVRQRRRLWKRRKRWKRWSEHWSVADDTSSFQIWCALEHVTIGKELGGAQVAFLFELNFHSLVLNLKV